MANPARIVTDQIIATAWGNDVADTVVRRYPNAATRDSDLAGHSTASLLGQVCVLTDTGAIQQYAGPIAGWRSPWSLPWGTLYSAINAGDANAGVFPGITIFTTAVPIVAGRLYKTTFEVCFQTDVQGYLRTTIDTIGHNHRCWVISNAAGPGTMTGFQYYAATSTRSATLDLAVISAFVRGTQSGSPSRIMFEDVGPAANPTAVVDDGAGSQAVDLDLLEPQYRGNFADDLDVEAAADDLEQAGQ